MKFNYTLDNLRGDIFGGLTCSVVGLPVALAFGVASGLGPTAGMYGAIAVGFFAAVFGGTRSQISGPTGPMSIAMAVIVTSHANSLAEAFTIVMLAGFIQAALGLARIGRFVAYTPYSVISGFMTGIGVIIMIVQIAPFLGSPVAVGGVIGAVNALEEVFTSVNFHALAVAAVTLVVGILWPRPFRRVLPAPLAAMAVGCALGILWLNDLPVIGNVPTGLPDLQFPVFSVGFILGALEPALVLALLGSIDSLLTSLIADIADPNAAQPQPGVDRPGHRQHDRRDDRRTARGGRDAGHGGQHPVRREHATVRSDSGRSPSGAGAWPGPVR